MFITLVTNFYHYATSIQINSLHITTHYSFKVKMTTIRCKCRSRHHKHHVFMNRPKLEYELNYIPASMEICYDRRKIIGVILTGFPCFSSAQLDKWRYNTLNLVTTTSFHVFSNLLPINNFNYSTLYNLTLIVVEQPMNKKK